jgi:hypothetical protein
MNLRDILNSVLGESGFLTKPAFASSSDQDDKQMIFIANRMAHEMMEWADWSVLKKSFKINPNGEAGGSTPDANGRYPLPTDFLSLVADSAWETDGSRRVEFPTPPNRWFMYKFSTFSDGGTLRARIYGDAIELHDTPADEFEFEYISKYPILDASGASKQYFTLDDDEFLLDDESLIKGIQSKWAKAKMMPQADEWKMDFLMSMNKAKARDTGGRTIGGVSNERSWWDSRRPYYPLYRR